ncbi:hypothetical protein Avbf_11849, partial [Armadillidium vulgare]
IYSYNVCQLRPPYYCSRTPSINLINHYLNSNKTSTFLWNVLYNFIFTMVRRYLRNSCVPCNPSGNKSEFRFKDFLCKYSVWGTDIFFCDR